MNITEAYENYPRPVLRREKYMKLDGTWSLNGSSILVPYPPESKASGYQGDLTGVDTFQYKTDFTLPADWQEERILLHFEAVDQIAEVFLNDVYLGKHTGGYLRFSFDVTQYVRRNGVNHLRVVAEDSNSTVYPYGKQSRYPQGMWYTGVSGIWKSVWLEPVPASHVKSLKITTDLSGANITLKLSTASGTGKFLRSQCTSKNSTAENSSSAACSYELYDGETKIDAGNFTGDTLRVKPQHPKLWSPKKPFLYKLLLHVGKDNIETYFALRTIEEKTIDGIPRILLNGEPIFLHGVLDQGYFMDGILTPKDYRDFEDDIYNMKKLGFNLLRKHIKVEPETFYYACDRLGMLVLQDMVNSGRYHFFADTLLPYFQMRKRADHKRLGMGQLRTTEKERRKVFIAHTKQTVRQLYNYPCIIGWTIFNEGWGQFESDRFYDMIKSMDPHRLIDSTSGWFAQEKSDFDSRHQYFRNRTLLPTGTKPIFVSECGGYGLMIEGHTFHGDKDVFQYGDCRDTGELTNKIVALYEEMILPAIPRGCCGAIYTQLCDVETELNGLYTYDRKVCKVIPSRMRSMGEHLNQMVRK